MADNTQPHTDLVGDAIDDEGPEISVCESCPGRSVFLEAGNRDGWIASDVTIDIPR